MIEIRQYEMRAARETFAPTMRILEGPGPGEALVRVAGCGLCHTDLAFHQGEVKTNHALPLTLGHEISGTVERAGRGAEAWVGKAVVVPAVVPCGVCDACRRGRYAVCSAQVFFGNDVHGGFASHVVAPVRALFEVPASLRDRLWMLSVVADAVSTPYEAIARSGLEPGHVAIFVGVGGVGGFGVQIAAALGAHVVAIDPSSERRELVARHGASLSLDPSVGDPGSVRRLVRGHVQERGLPLEEWRVFETSGTVAGQELAFSLLSRGGHLGIVGYAAGKASVHLSRLMALDARAEGNWACAPQRFPEVLRLVADGKIAIEPFVERRSLSRIDETFADLAAHRLHRRAVLAPDVA
jgi:6-hydroxycyclohex-1-ene-1-carbonyl-CoA dehydrogenase